MSSTVLLCPPKYYQIEYEINPWMHVENKVKKEIVQEEFEKLVAIYKKLGLNVLIIDPQPGLPDMVYAANFGFVIDDIFIRSNFRYPQRRKEAYFAEEFFKTLKAGDTTGGPQKRRSSTIGERVFYGGEEGQDPRMNNFQIKTLPKDIFFEGQGDMFYRDGKIFCGYGKRTMKEAIPHLEKILGEKFITFEVNDPYYYHLDTCFAPIGRGIAVIKPSSFDREDVVKMKKNFKKVIEVGERDNPFYCCNVVAVGDTLILGKGIGIDIKNTFAKAGFEIIETPMTEFLKGGGAVKCLTLEFFRKNN